MEQKYAETLENEIRSLASAQMPRAAIADELGISLRRVTRVLGIDVPAVIADYNARPHRRVRDIADDHGIDVPTLYDVLASNDIPHRTTTDPDLFGRRVDARMLELAVQFYLKGSTIGVITRDTDISAPTLYSELTRRNIPRRSRR